LTTGKRHGILYSDSANDNADDSVVVNANALYPRFHPLAGLIVAAALFSLVIGIYIFVGVAWIVGMVCARQAKMKPLPVIGGWAERLFTGKVA
jgi:uncharacterized membrane protein